MDNQLKTVWDSINHHIDESRILTMLSKENPANEVDYNRYLEYGYSRDDVAIGFELICIFEMLKKQIKEYE
jgi:hypothetical protein